MPSGQEKVKVFSKTVAAWTFSIPHFTIGDLQHFGMTLIPQFRMKRTKMAVGEFPILVFISHLPPKMFNPGRTIYNTEEKNKQMQPMRLCIHWHREFEETQRRKIKWRMLIFAPAGPKMYNPGQSTSFCGEECLHSEYFTGGEIWFADDLRRNWWVENQEMTVQPSTQRSLHTLVHLSPMIWILLTFTSEP